MNDETTHHHVAPSLEIKPPTGITPRKVKARTKIQFYTIGQLHDTLRMTTNLHSKAHASEEVGSPSAPRAMTSGSNRIALKTSFHNNRSRQSLTRSDSFARK